MTAYGKDAEQALSLLTPTIADSLSAVESIDLCMHVEDGVIRSDRSLRQLPGGKQCRPDAADDCLG